MIDELPFLHVVPSEIKKQTELFFAEHPHLTRVLTIDTYYDYTQQDGGGSHSLITTVEEAVRMGVDAVKMLFPWNISNSERADMCTRVGKVVTACDQWDIPLVVEPVLIGAPRTEGVIVEARLRTPKSLS